MIERSFSLVPFPDSEAPAVSIAGTACVRDRLLTVHFVLRGDLRAVYLPRVSPSAGRRDELWKSTCFEFFLGIRGEPGYWEFNLSPRGDWNAYRMDAYRRIGFCQEDAIPRLDLQMRSEADVFRLQSAVDLRPIVALADPLELGVSAILQAAAGQESYWALVHPGPRADFHLRESFILGLAGESGPAGRSAPGD